MDNFDLSATLLLVRIVIVYSRFLQRPHKQSRGNQHIHKRLTRTKI